MKFKIFLSGVIATIVFVLFIDFQLRSDFKSSYIGHLANLIGVSKSRPPRKDPKIFDDLSLKAKMPCPTRSEAVVIVLFGQSNSANHLGTRFDGSNTGVFNYFAGNCYRAKDPLLGATGKGGSVGIPLAREIQRTSGKSVVIASFGVGSTSILEWNNSNGLSPFLNKNLEEIKGAYESVDYVFWIQGESDHDTPTDTYVNELEQLVIKINKVFPGTKVGVSSTTFCAGKTDPELSRTQKEFSTRHEAAFWLGNTDDFKNWDDRWDGCHFSGTGALLIAKMFHSHMPY